MPADPAVDDPTTTAAATTTTTAAAVVEPSSDADAADLKPDSVHMQHESGYASTLQSTSISGTDSSPDAVRPPSPPEITVDPPSSVGGMATVSLLRPPCSMSAY